MKNKYYLATLLAAALFAACDDEENLNTQGAIDPADVPTVTLTDVPTSFTMVEEDMTIEIPVTLSKPFALDAEVHIQMTAGSATLGEDVEITGVRIENGDTEGVIEISIHGDDLPEETETATFKIEAGSNLSLSSSPEFTVTLENYVSPDLNIQVSWGADFYDEDPEDLVDFDLYVYSFDQDADVAAGETGSFEDFDLSGDEPDGDYLVYAFLWSDFDPGDFGPVEMPLTCTFNRWGVFSGLTLPQTEGIIDTDAGDYANDGEITLVELAIITKANGVYTIKTLDDVTVGGGRKRLPPSVIEHFKSAKRSK